MDGAFSINYNLDKHIKIGCHLAIIKASYACDGMMLMGLMGQFFYKVHLFGSRFHSAEHCFS
jgi:hypothetical protein